MPVTQHRPQVVRRETPGWIERRRLNKLCGHPPPPALPGSTRPCALYQIQWREHQVGPFATALRFGAVVDPLGANSDA